MNWTYGLSANPEFSHVSIMYNSLRQKFISQKYPVIIHNMLNKALTLKQGPLYTYAPKKKDRETERDRYICLI